MGQTLLPILVALPFAAAVVCLLLPTSQSVLQFVRLGVLGLVFPFALAICKVLSHGPLEAAGQWLRMDALSAYHLAVMMLVFVGGSCFSPVYFRKDIEEDHFSISRARRFGSLWFGALGAMTLVLSSNNLGILWVGVEASTLLTAFLICIHRTPASLEAMWKYLIICSVGVAFAFMGTLLAGASASGRLPATEALLWTHMMEIAPRLDPMLIKAGFIFLLVGYGTKAGLAPMHSWLPDAHSQAPAPVSALFSGFLLNSAFYCVLRYIPIVETALGHSGWSLRLLVFFGLLSILVSSAFMVMQKDLKRLLAYSTVEHIGIMAVGVGLGSAGAAASLFHLLNHSLGKTLAFLSAGRVGQLAGTNEIARLGGLLRGSFVWGVGLFWALLILSGVAPFAVFFSELQTLKAAADQGSWWTMGLFLFGVGVVFLAILRHAIHLAWAPSNRDVSANSSSWLEKIVVLCPLALLFMLGIWMPESLQRVIREAAAIIVMGGRQ
ncbi:MAG: proton-conducting transporter membrane subunit [Verrucomicrobiae bacterium]|nr:proton-conducting transporter membrane subunit [Verrucomicrobiae bacterium]